MRILAIGLVGLLGIAALGSPNLVRAGSGVITTAAGNGNVGFGGDGGLATAASLSQPEGLAFDAAGNLYIADQVTNSVRKVTASGVISTVAGTGAAGYSGDGGAATSATLNAPRGIALDGVGGLYIADANNNVVRKVNLGSGTISTFAGTGAAGYAGDGGPFAGAALHNPRGVTFDASGNLYIADTTNNVIREINRSTGIISTIAGIGSAGYNGDSIPAIHASLNSPRGVQFDGAGNLYIGDTGNNRVRKVNPAGTISTFAGTGTGVYSGDGGAATAASLSQPVGFAFDAAGNLYIADQGNNVVRMVTPGGVISTIAGNHTAGYGGDGGLATAAALFGPSWLAFDRSGDLFIADVSNARVREVSGAGPTTVSIQGDITTFAGNGTAGLSGDGGPATAAEVSQTDGLAFDRSGNLYIADQTNNTIRKVTPAIVGSSTIPGGYISNIAGIGVAGYAGDGAAATAAQLNSPHGMAFDQAGNLYFADTTNNVIREISVSSGTITTVAGTGAAGSALAPTPPVATASQLNAPRAVAIDGTGLLYVADSNNNRILTVNLQSGAISALTENAALNSPRALAFDTAGNLLIADSGNNVIRRGTVNTAATPPTLTTTVVAGNGSAGYSGDGVAATSTSLNGPRGVTVDLFGNIYISDYSNNRVRKVNPAGVISTIAGTGAAQFSGDGGPATAAGLGQPTWAVFDASGNLYISDFNDARVREIFGAEFPTGGPNTPAGTNVSVSPTDSTSGLQPTTLAFAAVLAAGQTTLITGVSVPTIPPSEVSCTPPLTMSIATTANFSGSVNICVTPIQLGSSCAANASLWQYSGGAWQPLSSAGGSLGQVCGVTSSLSQFAILSPTLIAQTITFSPIGNQSISASPIFPVATASSGLVVTFRSLTVSVCTVTGGAVTFLVPGTCNLGADQPGNSTYSAAPEVQQSFSITRATQTISFGAIGTQGLSASSFTVSATASSGLAVTFSSQTPSVCTVSGSTVTLLIAGTCTLAADQAGDVDFAAAAEVQQSFTVTPISQSISFAAIANAPLTPGAFVSPRVSASSGLGVTLLSQTTGICSVNGSFVSLIAIGTCTLQAAQPGNAVYAAAAPVTQSFSVRNVTSGGSAGTIITAVGDNTLGYSGDGGVATAASLSQPDGLVFDGSGNLYVADQLNNTVRKITPSGVISTFAGTSVAGYTGDGGQATQARINSPRGIAFDGPGNLYIADAGNNVIRKVTTAGVISTFAGTGTPGYSGDNGAPAAATFNSPRGLSFDAAGDLYIADTNNSVVRMISASTGLISTVAGAGVAGYAGDGGPATQAYLNEPRGVQFDGVGNLYIGDTANNRIRMVNTSGTISTLVGNGLAQYSGDGGPATSASLNGPRDVAFDGDGNLYIGDENNNAVRKVTPGGVITTIAGTGTAGFSGDGGAATAANLFSPGWLVLSPAGDLFVSDLANARVREIVGVGPSTIGIVGVINTVAGNGAAGNSGNGGPATAAALSQPNGLALDQSGNLYLADPGNETIRKITPPGARYGTVPGDYILAVAGTGASGFSGDNGLATAATFNHLSGVAFDAQGNLYVADTSNNRIRKIAAVGGVITTFAGTGTAGYSGDSQAATAAKLTTPNQVAFDGAGNLYIADTGNNVIRKVALSGTITTFAGNGTAGSGGNGGPATAANLSQPFGMAFDSTGNLYIADTGNNVIREVVSSGTITIFAGNGTAAFGGDGNPAISASLNGPRGLVFDLFGNLYISDYANNRVRKVTPAGVISTVAGNGSAAYSGDGGPATAASLNGPTWAAIDTASDLFISDLNNSRVREVFGAGLPLAGPNTAVGSNVSVTPTDSVTGLQVATITFSAVGTSGQTTVTTGISAPATPTIMATCAPPVTLDISTTASFNGSATVCLSPTELGSSCGSGASLWHYTGGSWQALAAPGNTPLGQVCGVTNSFSPFAILGPALPAQTISFAALANQTLGANPFTVSAAASSGLLVSFSSLTPTVCTVSSATVTLLGTGTCTIAADQAGNLNYAPAPEITQSFRVNAGILSQTITFASIGSKSLSALPITVSATATSGLTVTFSSQSLAVCSVSANSVALLATGTCTIAADQAGNAAYAPATEVTQSFSVSAALLAQTITFPAIGNQSLGTAPFAPTVSASSGLPVTLTSSSPVNCSVSGSTITLLAAGICTITANQAGNAAYAAAASVIQMFSVSAGTTSQTITFAAIGGRSLSASPFTVSATASSGLPVTLTSQSAATCAVSGMSVTLIAVGTCALQATQAGNATYAAATPVTQSFIISAGGGGSDSGGASDGPLPLWAIIVLGMGLCTIASRRLRPQ